MESLYDKMLDYFKKCPDGATEDTKRDWEDRKLGKLLNEFSLNIIFKMLAGHYDFDDGAGLSVLPVGKGRKYATFDEYFNDVPKKLLSLYLQRDSLDEMGIYDGLCLIFPAVSALCARDGDEVIFSFKAISI